MITNPNFIKASLYNKRGQGKKYLMAIFISSFFAFLSYSQLWYNNNIFEGIDTIKGLSRAQSVKVNEEFIYVSSQQEQSITVLRYLYDYNKTIIIQSLIQDTDFIDKPGQIEISKDKKFLFLTSESSNRINVFQINELNGKLNLIQSFTDYPMNLTNSPATSISMSSNNKNLYVTYLEDYFAHFLIDQTSGELTLNQVIENGVEDNLGTPVAIAVNDDGSNIFVGCSRTSSISYYKYDSVLKRIFLHSILKNGINGVNGLKSIRQLVISNDSKYLFSGSWNTLSAIEIYEDSIVQVCYKEWKGQPELKGLWDIKKIIVDEDDNVLIGSFLPNSISKFNFNKGIKDFSLTYFFALGSSGMVNVRGIETFDVDTNKSMIFSIDYWENSLKIIAENKDNPEIINTVFYNDATNTALNKIDQLAISKDNQYIYASSSSNSTIGVYLHDTIQNKLIEIDVLINNTDSVEYIANPGPMLISPDNNHLYVISKDNKTLTVLKRQSNGTGFKTIQILPEISIKSSKGKNKYDICSDYKMNNIYVSNESDNIIISFERNEATGQLTLLETIQGELFTKDLISNATLRHISGLKISSDDNYIIAFSEKQKNLFLFERDTITGILSLVQIIDKSSIPSEQESIKFIPDAKFSIDNKYLFVSSSNKDLITLFEFDDLLEKYIATNYNALENTSLNNNIDEFNLLRISKDNKYLIAVSEKKAGIVIFSINDTSGKINEEQIYRNNDHDVFKFSNPKDIIITNKYLFIASETDNAISIFEFDDRNVGISPDQMTEKNKVNDVVGNIYISDNSISKDFKLLDINPVGPFAINNDQLIATDVISASDTNQYKLKIKTVDLNDKIYIDEYYIDILEKNDAPKISDTTFTIIENSPLNYLIGTLFATDEENDPLIFSIDAAIMPYININSTSAEISIVDNSIFDFESTNLIIFEAYVSDGISLDTATITINIENTNDNAPVTNHLFINVDENLTAGTLLGTVQATDLDGDILNYSLYGTYSGAIQINNSTGEITIYDVNYFDYENTTGFSVNVIVTDGFFSDTSIIEISINNINDNIPILNSSTFSVEENSVAGTYVGQLIGADDDNDDISYTITGGNINNTFEINSTTGELIIANSTVLDYETHPSFNLTIEVSDGIYSSTAEITINIIDMIETNLNKTQNNVSMKIYPNPSTGEFSIHSGDIIPKGTMIEIKNIQGRTIYSYSPESSTNSISVNLPGNIKQGIYFLSIRMMSGFVDEKLIINPQ